MYLHVPAAWLGMMCYMVMTSAALGTLVWRHPLADAAQRAAAPLGAAFTLVCLVTGSLWGRPTWGTYWVWDARLTSVLVLFLLYLGVLALYWTAEDPGRGAVPGRLPGVGHLSPEHASVLSDPAPLEAVALRVGRYAAHGENRLSEPARRWSTRSRSAASAATARASCARLWADCVSACSIASRTAPLSALALALVTGTCVARSSARSSQARPSLQ